MIDCPAMVGARLRHFAGEVGGQLGGGFAQLVGK